MSLGEKEQRQFPIAYLPKITRLNGSRIQDNEREDAERALMRYYMSQEDKPNRYFELEKQHGKLNPLANVDFSKKPNQVTIVLHYQGKSELMKLNIKWTVADLWSHVKKHCNVPPSKKIILYLNGGERLVHSKRALHALPVREGDDVFVEE